MRNPPLHGVRVLDLTRLLPGPLCSQHLADMGADVIKVEDTGAGDYARSMRGYYALVNRNKRSIKLDLKQEQGRAAFMKLCGTANVVVEGFRPGVVDRLGVGYDAVREVNRRIVYCALSGYGQTGPFRQQAGHDLNYLAYTGITEQIGTRGGEPAMPNLQIADFLGGTLERGDGHTGRAGRRQSHRGGPLRGRIHGRLRPGAQHPAVDGVEPAGRAGPPRPCVSVGRAALVFGLPHRRRQIRRPGERSRTSSGRRSARP